MKGRLSSDFQSFYIDISKLSNYKIILKKLLNIN